MAHADVIVVGAGLAGLVATAELAETGKRVLLLEQEPEASFGGQAWWSFGGLFLVDTPEQRRLRIKDSRELALRDWIAYAEFDRQQDAWPRRWAEAYVGFASGEMRAWLHGLGIRFFPLVQWAERRGNSVPRFHITWGTGPAVVEPFARRVREAEALGRVSIRFRHRVAALTLRGGAVTGVSGDVLAESDTPRGAPSSRVVVASFAFEGDAVLLASGGIGARHDLVRSWWPSRLGTPPQRMLSGVPDHVDGLGLLAAREAGASAVNLDRMWNYPEGVENFAPVWSRHGIRILSGPTPLWLDATGARLPAPAFPGFDALGALERVARSGHDHSWLVMDTSVFGRELALSGSEQNPDLTGKSIRLLLQRALPSAVKPVAAFGSRGADFVFAAGPDELAAGMSALAGPPIEAASLARTLREHDEQNASPAPTDAQAVAIRDARRYLGDRLIRVARPHRMLDPRRGPLVAVRCWIVTRKTLGGLETDLGGRVLTAAGTPLAGLYAAGEVAGFGGGGYHGYRSLEGTFLGGFSGLTAARALGPPRT